MPTQKRPRETSTPPPSPPPPLEVEKDDDSLQGGENRSGEEDNNATDSEESEYSSGGKKDEFIVVNLAEMRKEFQCPICLGIIRKTRTVMECLHRFCRECIDKSMRLGNNECPACRTHCASRRSLRDDPNYDALIAALYPDIDKYEEEELALHEEEKARNKQIQASITQTFRRQAEALGKKRTSARAGPPIYYRRQGNYRNVTGRRNNRVRHHHGSDEEEGANGRDGSKDLSSADEQCAEVKPKRYTRRNSLPSSGTNENGGCDDNDSELLGALLGSTEFIAWGRGGMRSNTRHGGVHCSNGRHPRNNRLTKLIDHLQSSHENDEMLKISLMLVSLNKAEIPSLNRPYLCCSPTASVRHLCQYVAMQTSVEASEIEMLLIKEVRYVNNHSILTKDSGFLMPREDDELQLLNEHQTLEELHAHFNQQNLFVPVLVYRKKIRGEGN